VAGLGRILFFAKIFSHGLHGLKLEGERFEAARTAIDLRFFFTYTPAE
jgi:hypothetical protein